VKFYIIVISQSTQKNTFINYYGFTLYQVSLKLD
jgi:hypothetical protein